MKTKLNSMWRFDMWRDIFIWRICLDHEAKSNRCLVQEGWSQKGWSNGGFHSNVAWCDTCPRCYTHPGDLENVFRVVKQIRILPYEFLVTYEVNRIHQRFTSQTRSHNMSFLLVTTQSNENSNVMKTGPDTDSA